MGNTTVNLSFQEDLLERIDAVAQRESRSRSELIREAARQYVERRNRWESAFEIGEKIAQDKGLRPEDVESEIRDYRENRRTESQ